MTGQRDLAVLVLDGGRATRMGGAHKSFLLVGGEPIAARTLRAVRPLVRQVLVATSRPEPWSDQDVELVDDVAPGAGPLSGIAGGLAAARTSWLLVVAGDMPHVSRAVVEALVDCAIAVGRSSAPVIAGRVEPLCAVYATRESERARAAVLAGVRRPADFLALVGFEAVDETRLRHCEGFADAFANVNTPADHARSAGDDGGPGARSEGS